MFKFKYDYEFNLLGVENYNLSPRMIFIKKFIENHSNVEGDYYEFGVFQGSSIISVALIFKFLRIKKNYMALIVLVVFQTITKKINLINLMNYLKKGKFLKNIIKML